METDTNQNTNTFSCLPYSIEIIHLQDITVNTNESDENLIDEIKDIETAKIIIKVVATTSEESDNSNVNDITSWETNE